MMQPPRRTFAGALLLFCFEVANNSLMEQPFGPKVVAKSTSKPANVVWFKEVLPSFHLRSQSYQQFWKVLEG